MTGVNRATVIPSVLREKPLQAGKFLGILLALTMGVAGFFRIIDAGILIDDPVLGDGQFLALIAIPLVSFGLVCLVVVETLVTAARVLRSDTAISEQLAGRLGYVLLRSIEAGIALLGVLLMISVVPVLVAESTPAPAGVGAMLLLFAVGVGILVVSLIRSSLELFVYDASN